MCKRSLLSRLLLPLVALLLLVPAQVRAATELRLAVWDGDESLRILRKVADDFEAAHPGIKVRLENVDYRYFFQRLLSQIAGNSAPDVTMLDPQKHADVCQAEDPAGFGPSGRGNPIGST